MQIGGALTDQNGGAPSSELWCHTTPEWVHYHHIAGSTTTDGWAPPVSHHPVSTTILFHQSQSPLLRHRKAALPMLKRHECDLASLARRIVRAYTCIHRQKCMGCMYKWHRSDTQSFRTAFYRTFENFMVHFQNLCRNILKHVFCPPLSIQDWALSCDEVI